MTFNRESDAIVHKSFSDLYCSLLCWYPIKHRRAVLLVGNESVALKEYLETQVKQVDFLPDTAPCEYSHKTYDLILLLVDPAQNRDSLAHCLNRFHELLEEDGVLLLGYRNRFAMKYLCGKTDPFCNEPFSNFSEHTVLFSRKTMDQLALQAGFPHAFHYYPLPDRMFVQAVYSDAKIPEESIHDRVFPYDPYEGNPIFPESELLKTAVEEGALPEFSNYCLTEYRKTERSEDAYPTAALLSADRGPEHSFATVFMSNHTVVKKPVYPEGIKALTEMYQNIESLKKRGLLTVEQTMQDGAVHMPEVTEETLLSAVGRMIREKDKAGITALFDRMYENILKSSERSDINRITDADWTMPEASIGPVLSKAYIDMIPYNGFLSGNDIRYYDQEFSRENCPAGYVIFRAVYYTYIHFPELESLISQQELKDRFHITDCWDMYVNAENRFVSANRNWERYGQIYQWAYEDRERIERTRNRLKEHHEVSQKEYNIGLLMGVFDLFHVGHLRLIQRAKEHCNYLRVAVLSDELVMKFKNHPPVIPLAERMEILANVKGVNEVVAIEDDPSRLLEHSRRPFDCFFSGDDYAGNEYWKWEKEELRKLGADIVFFPYTKEQSSTMIRRKSKTPADS